MSLPSFPVVNPPIEREDAVNQILSSIAMEELGLSHILNAEGEKLQYILGTLPGLSGPPATVSDVLAANESVRSLSLDNPILVVAIFVAAVIALLYWFFGTELGASLRATGSNPNMSRAQGINTNFTKVLGLMLSNGLVALSSALLAQYQGFADVNMGRGAIVIGLAAVIIGEVIFGKVFRNFALKMLAVAIGAILYYLVYQVVIWLGLNTDDMKLITALIVAAFLAIPYWKGKYAHVKVPAGSANAGAKTGGDQDA